MAVDKNAVREGTRWSLREGATDRTVVVEEVTGRSVIFTEAHCFKTEVMKLEGFLARASDPLKAEHARLMEGLVCCAHGQPVDSPTAKLLMTLRDAAVYLLERMPPTVPPYVEPAPPTPKVEPLPASAVAALSEAYAVPGDICGCDSCTVEAPHASDCAVHNEPAYPAGPCDCDAVAAEPDPGAGWAVETPVFAPPSLKKRRL